MYDVREVPEGEPGPGEVRIRVLHCGFCHSDENIRSGRGGIHFPRVPGHEVAGVIEAIGDAVPDVWRTGDRVGVGWHGGHCLSCDACRGGDFLRCPARLGCGSSYDGGFAETTVVPWTALARVPDGMDLAEAGPIMCAGITVWNGLRRTGASWGDTVAVQGLGGLGHLAVQYAAKMGFRTVAVSRGEDKRELAHDLGAHDYIDANAEDPGKALRALGGARGIVATAPTGKAMRPLVPGLGPDGRLVVVGVADDELGAPVGQFLHNQKGIVGSVIGTPREIERLLEFGYRMGVRPWIERFRLADIEEATRRLHEGSLRFRAVLDMPGQ